MTTAHLVSPPPFPSTADEVDHGAISYEYAIDGQVTFKCATSIESRAESLITIDTREQREVGA